jgi:hypothetical protein
MKSRVAWHVHLYSCSVHASASTVGVTVAAADCNLPGISGKWWAVVERKSIFYVPTEKEIKWCKATGTKWPRHKDTFVNPLPWKLSIQEGWHALQCQNAAARGCIVLE